MAIEYLVKDKRNGKIIARCETSEQAQRELREFLAASKKRNPRHYAVFYSADALKARQGA